MPDRRTDILLNTINTLCKEGSFRVVDEDELLSAYSVRDGVDAKSVRDMLDYLRGGGYIDVQYAEEGVYCVRPLPQGRLYFERAKQRKSEGKRKQLTSFFMTALSAFAGALLASLSVWILSLFV